MGTYRDPDAYLAAVHHLAWLAADDHDGFVDPDPEDGAIAVLRDVAEETYAPSLDPEDSVPGFRAAAFDLLALAEADAGHDLSERAQRVLGSAAAGSKLGDLSAALDLIDRMRETEARLVDWLTMIDGGDTPCDDAAQLREWAMRALRGQEPTDA